MNSNLYLLRALTNLHVGSGDSHYGVIDKLVQRDVLTHYPTVHASSLKGALREAFEQTPGLNRNSLRDIFGAEGEATGQAGGYSFGTPQLLAFPVRSDKAPFLRVTSPGLIQHLLDSQTPFGFTLADQTNLVAFADSVKAITVPTVFESTLQGAILERHSITATFKEDRTNYPAIAQLFGDHVAVVPDIMLAKLCGENRLPVIARNRLENGISRNLWYEEVVPRQTLFWFWLYPKKNDAVLATDFSTLISNPVQIGANASIGYGICEITRSL